MLAGPSPCPSRWDTRHQPGHQASLHPAWAAQNGAFAGSNLGQHLHRIQCLSDDIPVTTERPPVGGAEGGFRQGTESLMDATGVTLKDTRNASPPVFVCASETPPPRLAEGRSGLPKQWVCGAACPSHCIQHQQRQSSCTCLSLGAWTRGSCAWCSGGREKAWSLLGHPPPAFIVAAPVASVFPLLGAGRNKM